VRALACLLLFAGAADPAPSAPPLASPVSVTVTPSKQQVSFGEPFTLEVRATGPAGTAFTFPGELVTDTFELRAAQAAADASSIPEPGTQRYQATVFALGDATLPPILVRFRLADGTEGEAASETTVLQVASLLPKDAQQQKLADIRGPRSVGIGRAFWVAFVASLVLVAALVTWLIRRRRKAQLPAAPASAPALSPDVEALRALEALAAAGLLARGEYRPFYIRLTALAKRYLERRLLAPILEMTSAETLAFLRAHTHGNPLLPAMRDLALAADQIKFARGAGRAQEAERHLAAVQALVPALESRLRPALPPDAADGKAA